MALFRVERYVGEISAVDIDAGVFRAMTCEGIIAGVRWLRSYYDPKAQHFTCYYEANCADDLRAHAAYADLPCDLVAEVIEYLPEQYR